LCLGSHLFKPKMANIHTNGLFVEKLSSRVQGYKLFGTWFNLKSILA
jgi:hypothetical protein